MQKVRQKCVTSRQSSQNWPKEARFFMLKLCRLERSTPLQVVEGVTYISYAEKCPQAHWRGVRSGSGVAFLLSMFVFVCVGCVSDCV